jgi:hypothetical protein
MEFASFTKFNGSLTVHFFTSNLQVYALDGCDKAIKMWDSFSDDDKKYFIERAMEKINKIESEMTENESISQDYNAWFDKRF